jgi:hypothetical protein
MKTQLLVRIVALACAGALVLSVPGGTQASSLTSISLSTAATVESHHVEVEGHIGGPVDTVAVQGSYVYTGEGLNLVVLNVSSPISPTVAIRLLRWIIARFSCAGGITARVLADCLERLLTPLQQRGRDVSSALTHWQRYR